MKIGTIQVETGITGLPLVAYLINCVCFSFPAKFIDYISEEFQDNNNIQFVY